jgi:hypothetical protein
MSEVTGQSDANHTNTVLPISFYWALHFNLTSFQSVFTSAFYPGSGSESYGVYTVRAVDHDVMHVTEARDSRHGRNRRAGRN